MGTPPHGGGQLDLSCPAGPVPTSVTQRAPAEQPDTTAAALTAQVSRMLCDAWRLRVDGPWTTALPAENERGQGAPLDPSALPVCRIHLSATPRSAATVLDRVVPVLAARGIVFSFAADLEAVRWLGSRDCESDVAGKVLTACPGPGIDFAELAQSLHAATSGLPGPRILTARPYRAQSLVHYSLGRSSPDSESSCEPLGPNDHPDGRRTGTPTLLAGRYLLGQALRHTPSNSVHLAVDTHASGEAASARVDSSEKSPADARVVIDHARRHADIDELGQDARARLLHQARILRHLHHSVPVPEPLRVFALDQDLFLVQRYLNGVSFTRWVAAQAADTPGVPLTIALPMARRLLRMVSTVHQAGIVLRDLTPSKILIAPDGRPMLVDLEAAYPVATVARRIDTGSYRAPEQCASSGPPEATITEDLYRLGGLLFLMATGADPVLPAHDDGYDRQDRLSTWLRAAAEHNSTARALTPAALGLLADDPAHRCDLVTAAARLDPRHQGSIGHEQAPCPGSRRLLDDGLSHLADTMTPSNEQLWPHPDQGSPVDVQHGAAGVLAVFLRDLETGNQRHREVASGATNWLMKMSRAHPSQDCQAPGLYTGRAGVIWAMSEAGWVLGEEGVLEHAQDAARALPTTFSSAGVAFGLAGTLLTQLKLYALTGRDEFAELATACGNAIRQAAVPTRSGPLWLLPDTFDRHACGTAHYGFAHGAAGIGYALLVAGLSLSDDRALTLALEVGDLLCDAAVPAPGDRMCWPIGPDNPRRRSHWCAGASGIGTFLLRLWAFSRQARFAQYSRAAADSVFDVDWASSTSMCHGATGDGQFLLDAAELLPEPRYRRRAEDLVALLSARHARRRGRGVVADDTGLAVSSSFGTGLAGVVSFLLRLEHSGARSFMLDAAFGPMTDAGTSSAPNRRTSGDSAATDRELA